MPTSRVSYKSKDQRTLIVFEATDEKMLVKHLAQVQIIMENDTCQACIDLGRDPKQFGAVLNSRTSKGFTYYAWICQNPDCGARLEFGEHKVEAGGGFYIKRANKEGEQWIDIEHRGWTWYRRESQPQPATAPAPQAAPAPSAPPVDDDSIPF